MPGFEIGDDIVGRPRADSPPRIVRDFGREPALQRVTLQLLAGLVGA
jgi:hypothetical protein